MLHLGAVIGYALGVALHAAVATQETGMLRSSRLRLQLFCNQLTPSLSAQETFQHNLRRVWQSLALLRLLSLALLAVSGAVLALPAPGAGHWGLNALLALALVATALIAGDAAPRLLARRHPDRALNLCSPSLRVQHSLLGALSGWLVGRRGPVDDAATELPPGASAAAGLMAQSPHLDTPQASVSPIPELGDEVFSAALDFNLIRVSEFMVPRTEIVAFELGGTVEALRQQFIETKLSRIVVHRGSLDEIVGIVHSSALLEAERPPTALEPLIQPLLNVPETLPANQLLREFNRHRRSIAAVVDEFGGTAGLVTLEDLVEVIVGEIDDEYDEPKDPERIEEPLGPDAWRLSARLEVEYLNRTYDLDIPDGDGAYTTLGGYVLHVAERIPEVGEVIRAGGLRLTVLAAAPNRLVALRVERGAPEGAAAKPEAPASPASR